MNRNKIFFFTFIFLPFMYALGVTRNYIAGNKFRACADHIVEDSRSYFNPEDVKPKSIIYCDVWSTDYFFQTIFPRIKNPFILITHNGDLSAPGNHVHCLSDSRILMWFGQNCDIPAHPKFCPIPIGLANHPKWPHGNPQIFDEVLDYLELYPYVNKSVQLYVNIAQTTPLRKYVYKKFKNKSFVKTISRKPIKEFLLEMAHYQFILSPFGGGLDCHRTWEALLVGSIPVVKTSTLDPLYEDLPVIIVQDWNEITQEFLNEQYQLMKSKNYNYEKLFMDYWIMLIKNYQASLS